MKKILLFTLPLYGLWCCEVYRKGELHYSKNQYYAKTVSRKTNTTPQCSEESTTWSAESSQSTEQIDKSNFLQSTVQDPQETVADPEKTVTAINENTWLVSDVKEPEKNSKKKGKINRMLNSEQNKELPINLFAILSLAIFPMAFIFSPIALVQILKARRTKGVFFAIFGFLLFMILIAMLMSSSFSGSNYNINFFSL